MRGSITFFYACLSLLMIALFGALCESVRVKTAGSMLSDSSYLALQNSLAAYQWELWQDYHVFFLDIREAGGTESLRQEIQESLDISWSQESIIFAGDWMNVSCEVDECTPYRYMIDQNAKEFEDQVVAYMQYSATGDLIEEMLESLNLLKGLQKGQDIISKKLKLEESYAGLEKKKNQIYGNLNTVSKQWEQAKQRIDLIQDKWQQWELEEKFAAIQAEKETENKNENAGSLTETRAKAPDIMEDLSALKNQAQIMLYLGDSVQKSCQDYQIEYQNTIRSRREYETWLDSCKETMDTQSWNALRDDLNELTALGQSENQYVSILKQDLSGNAQVLQAMIDWCNQGMRIPETATPEQAKMWLFQYQDNLIPQQYQMATVEAQKTSPFTSLKEYASKGVLSLVLPAGTTVSEKTIQTAGWQAGQTLQGNMEADNDKQSLTGQIVTESVRAGLLSLYAGKHFGCFGAKKENTALEYEQEYLLIGSESDTENLAGVAGELLLIRTTSDFLSIITKSDKVAQAKSMAVAIAGVTGATALVPLIKTGILLLWAVEDAVKDVRNLFQGKSVPLYQSVRGFAPDYQGYLLLLLLTTGSQRGKRMVQLLEENIRLRYQPAFSAADCAAGLDITICAEISPRFFYNRIYRTMAPASAKRLGAWNTTTTYRLGYYKGMKE